ncbi:MAG: insulinase family protein, partial [Gammaproteobacteria bacterium]|nr:insulinase family protein [Gammaproteobacteria bacterium]
MKSLFRVLAIVFTLSVFTSSLQAKFSLPEYETYTLKNGLQVYLMQQTEVPMVNVSLVIKAGAIHDGKQFGLANLTGESIQFGSGKLTKTQIEDELAFMGAELSSITSTEMTRLTLSFLNKDKTKLLPLFADVALKPTFDQQEFTKFKKRFLAQLEQRKESPRNII